MSTAGYRMSRMSPGELLCSYRAGELHVVHELMLRYRRCLSGVARKYLTDQSDIDDAIQDTWVAFVRHHDCIQEPECVGSWLRSTCARAALGIALRQNRLQSTTELADPFVIDPVDDAAGLDAEWRHRAVHNALTRLTGRDRKLIEALMADRRVSYAAVSKATGRPIGSIGPSRKRILDKLTTDPDIVRLRLAY
jgi:RNA polymerase sigma factor (sigma-70 family)